MNDCLDWSHLVNDCLEQFTSNVIVLDAIKFDKFAKAKLHLFHQVGHCGQEAFADFSETDVIHG